MDCCDPPAAAVTQVGRASPANHRYGTETPMRGLRLLLVTGCLGAITLALATASWQAHLKYGAGTWIMDLGRHPVWDPPAAPDYDAFRQHFDRSKEFPPERGGWGIHLHCDPFDVGLLALAYSWPVAFLCGLVYQHRCESRRDLTLQCAFWAAVGTFLGIAGSIILWLIWGDGVQRLWAASRPRFDPGNLLRSRFIRTSLSEGPKRVQRVKSTSRTPGYRKLHGGSRTS